MSPATEGLQVRKYGGSSVADTARLTQVATSVAAGTGRGRPMVVVVSAQGDTTDDLLRVAAAVCGRSAGREIDQLLATGESAAAALLAMALEAAGVPAVSLTGAQAGVHASGPPGAGLIAGIDAARIRRYLTRSAVVVVSGFQGVDAGGDVLTLGRGASDTTAVALAAALGVDHCEICTDVDGVFSADPRVLPGARLLPVLDGDVMVELAFAGARVLHSRAVEMASARGIELVVRHSSSTRPGTVIRVGSDPTMLERWGIAAVAHDLDVARVLVHSANPLRSGHRRDLAADLLGVLAAQHVAVDLVARSGPAEEEFRMGFTVRQSEVHRVVPALRSAMSGVDGSVTVDEGVAKVSIVGTGLLNRPEYTARMLSALSAAGIATSWVSVSQLRTSVTVPLERVLDAVALLHREFELDATVASGSLTDA